MARCQNALSAKRSTLLCRLVTTSPHAAELPKGHITAQAHVSASLLTCSLAWSAVGLALAATSSATLRMRLLVCSSSQCQCL